MSKALPGSHYCEDHQGNHSHYAKHNCELCKALAERDALLKLTHCDCGDSFTDQDAGTCVNCKAAIESRAYIAERERDALLADAERYRWLRVNPIRFKGSGIVLAWSPNELDDAIDAARSKP